MSASVPVTRSSLPRVFPIAAPLSMPELPARIFTDEEWQQIRLGYQAQDMDERWDVFTEDQVVFLHRSWTGYGIYEASLTPADGGGWRIGTAVVESDPDRYRRSSHDYDRVLLELLLVTIVLGQPAAALRAELVTLATQNARSDVPAGLVEHHAVGWRAPSKADR
ncbi:hypothetical protein KZZ52_43905 [Dactylosporangium sp. AC04546]|uniref:hypothetical protein n=1 Tax=Dactylosporangium sp. AC04546 TaxID=2862460 RepID=UPI001EE01BFA|nr:hypothetical protein [Dactylosporangium sp. AC04546]WVK80861.1 hypothetical protein KZZ52_43905 [Dactylosporangium sp. AC04546]